MSASRFAIRSPFPSLAVPTLRDAEVGASQKPSAQHSTETATRARCVGVFVLPEREVGHDSSTVQGLDDDRQEIPEYGAILAMILVLVFGTIRLIGWNTNSAFSTSASSI